MKAIDILVDEHRLIMRMLQVIGRLEQLMGNGVAFQAAMIERILDFMTGYTDEFHHHREEDLLIDLLARHGHPMDHGPVGLVMQDHSMARFRTRRLRELLPAAAAGDSEAQMEMRHLLDQYNKLVRCHIGMEDLSFFPHSRRTLTGEALEELEDVFRAADAQPAARKIDKHYRALVEELEAEILELAKRNQGG